MLGTHRDRGAPHDAAPPTPPGIRVTYLGGSIGLSFSMCSRAFGFYHRQDRFGRSAAVRSRGASPTRRSQSFGPSSVVSGAAYLLLRLSDWSASLALPTARPTMPSADSCAVMIGAPYDFPSYNNGTWRRPPQVSSIAFTAPPPDLQPLPLMEPDFAIRCPLVRPRMPNLVSVRQVAALLHTSFRRHLAMTPLCFASPSPPSGWTGDFHPQAIEHAGHTTKPANAGAR